ncbi:MAG: hypothetical protein Q4B90_04655 [Eubacteriales bacterium]|nr:hypothetical protein [Eubacteriales bacterium]
MRIEKIFSFYFREKIEKKQHRNYFKEKYLFLRKTQKDKAVPDDEKTEEIFGRDIAIFERTW